MVIRTPEELLEKLTLQEENVPTFRVEIGATAEDIAEITRDKQILRYVLDRANIVEAGKKATNGMFFPKFSKEMRLSKPLSRVLIIR